MEHLSPSRFQTSLNFLNIRTNSPHDYPLPRTIQHPNYHRKITSRTYLLTLATSRSSNMARFDVDFQECTEEYTGLRGANTPSTATRTPSEVSSISSSMTITSSRTSVSTHTATDDKGRPWWKGQVCYQVWPMSFKDSNGGQQHCESPYACPSLTFHRRYR